MNYYERRRKAAVMVDNLAKAGKNEEEIARSVLRTYGLSKKFVTECLG